MYATLDLCVSSVMFVMYDISNYASKSDVPVYSLADARDVNLVRPLSSLSNPLLGNHTT